MNLVGFFGCFIFVRAMHSVLRITSIVRSVADVNSGTMNPAVTTSLLSKASIPSS